MTLRRDKTIFISASRDTTLPAPDAENVLLKDISVQTVDSVDIVRTHLVDLHNIKSILPYYKPRATIVKIRI